MTDQLQKQIDKLAYHVKLLSEAMDHRENPIASLVISMNWDDEQLNKAHDIFEKYDKKIHDKEININWRGFEMELREVFNIGYQTVKSIVLAFFDNNQWESVCFEYAKAFECVEFHRITRPKK